MQFEIFVTMIIFLFQHYCDIPRLSVLQFYSHAAVAYWYGVFICLLTKQTFLSLAKFTIITIFDLDFGAIGEVLGGVVKIVIATSGYCNGTEIGINSSVAIGSIHLRVIYIKLYKFGAIGDIPRNSTLNLREYLVLGYVIDILVGAMDKIIRITLVTLWCLWIAIQAYIVPSRTISDVSCTVERYAAAIPILPTTITTVSNGSLITTNAAACLFVAPTFNNSASITTIRINPNTIESNPTNTMTISSIILIIYIVIQIVQLHFVQLYQLQQLELLQLQVL